MNELLERLRGRYSIGVDGVKEDRDFGSFTPAICEEAATVIEKLIADNMALINSSRSFIRVGGRKSGIKTINSLIRERDQLQQEAINWASEAKAQTATIHEIYQGLGLQLGDWNGARPVLKKIKELESDALSMLEEYNLFLGSGSLCLPPAVMNEMRDEFIYQNKKDQ